MNNLALRGSLTSWALLGFLLFILFNAYAGHREWRQTADEFAAGTWRPTPAGLVRGLRAYGTNDYDVLRYFAYCNAALGRPYQASYVRPLSSWVEKFSAGKKLEGLDMAPSTIPDRPLIPYRDYLVEYPPGFFLFALPPALLTRDGDMYRHLFSSFMALLLIGALLLCRRLSLLLPETSFAKTLTYTAAAIFAIGVVATRRYDAAISWLLCLACFACLTDRLVLCGVAIGVAAASKGIPLLILPLVGAYLLSARRLRGLLLLGAVAALSCAAICVPALLLGGSSILDAVDYHAQRPLQVESTAGALLGVLQLVIPNSLRLVHSYGSSNLAGTLVPFASAATTVLGGLMIVLAYLRTWVRLQKMRPPSDRARELLRGVILVFSIFLLSAKVLSPQYLIWLLPLGVLLSTSAASRFVLVAAMALTQVIYPICYGFLEDLAPWAFALVLLRNGLLAAWAVLVCTDPKRPQAVGTASV